MKSDTNIISIIEGLFPPDSEYEDSAKIGRAVQAIAEREMAGWRTLPQPVLVRMCDLMRQLDSSPEGKGVAWSMVQRELRS